jgi:hypothetical protein
MATKGTETKKAQTEKTSKFSFKLSDWPLGNIVEYTGTRVTEHVGMSGEIVGYRPSNGLWVQFKNGKGSISVKQAKLTTRKATRKPAVKVTPGAGELETAQAEAEQTA